MTLIIVEGTEDIHFVRHLLAGKECEIIQNGSHGISDSILSDIEQTVINKDISKIAIINDADNDFSARLNELETAIVHKINPKLKNNTIPCEIFLFPNNSSDGTLENLLLSCARENKKYILECHDRMINCLKANEDHTSLVFPTDKNKAYVYVDLNLTKQEKDNRKNVGPYGYHRPDIWDFQCEAIKPLLDFLKNL
ncbi:MAG: DUF3226 domain-containing protein [Brevinema sp.]